MSNSNIPPYNNRDFIKNLHNPYSYNDVISNLNATFKSIVETHFQSNKDIENIVKSFEIHDMNKQLKDLAINSGLIKASSSFMSEQFAKDFACQVYVSDTLKRVLESSVALYKVEKGFYSNYLKNSIFDIYDLHTEINTDSEEDTGHDFQIENVEFFEEYTDTDDVKKIITVIPCISVLDKVKDSNIDVLDWRELEELIAVLLREDGWNAELQQGSKDGGADVIATKEIQYFGFVKCIFQAKKYSIKNKVELPAIKELAFNREEFRANKAILVTTSFLTKGARDLIQRDNHLLGKMERNELELWVSDVINRR